MSAATSRAMPVSERQSARFGVSLSVSRRSSRSRYWRMLGPTGASAGEDQRPEASRQCRVRLAEQSMPEDLDAAHLGDLDGEVAGQLGAGSAHGTLRPAARWRAADDLQLGAGADVDLADVEAVGVGMLHDFEHLRHDDVVERGRDGFFFLDSRPAIVRGATALAREADRTKLRSQDSENFMIRNFRNRMLRRTGAGSAGRRRRTGAGH